MVEDADGVIRILKCNERHERRRNQRPKNAGTWVHGSGMFHTADPVETPADLEGMKIVAVTLVNDLLTRVGATPVGQACSRGCRSTVKRCD